MRFPIALACALLLAACSGSSPAPRGWQPVAGASNVWSTGSGAERQEYSIVRSEFEGSLQDLASRVTIDALMRDRGAKLRGSTPFAACPGAAGVATFQRTEGTTLQVGFAVRNGRAVRIRYLRPTGSPVDPNVEQAMQTTLCAL